MKKKKKAYFSKTFIYLVLLIATVAGFFLMVNYATNQKLSMNSEASFNKCQAFRKTKKINNCQDVKKQSKDIRNFILCEPGKERDPKYIYCRAVNIDKGKDCRQVGGSGADWYSYTKEKAQEKWSKNYLVSVTDYTNFVSKYYRDQHKGKNCLSLGKMMKKQTCAQVADEWVNGTCAGQKNGKFTYTRYSYSYQLSDYKEGKECCYKTIGME